MQVFELRHGKHTPSHLDLLDPRSDLRSIGFRNIDVTHRQGMIHTGAWIHLVDTSLSQNPKVLLLRRGKGLVTCPDTWSLIGEHAYRDETPVATVERALLEELGPKALQAVQRQGSITNLTAAPVYYERQYGPGNGNRIDRQCTYLWLVEMNVDGDNIGSHYWEEVLDIDNEAIDHVWKSLDELERWMESGTALQDFCHDSILSLLRLGMDRMKVLKKAKK